MEIAPKRKRQRERMSRAQKLANLTRFSRKPAEVLREQCPTRCRIVFSVYHYDRQCYLPLPGAPVKLLIRNAREFARLRKAIEAFVDGGGHLDEKNEGKPDPPTLEQQLDPALHGNQHRAFDSD